MMTEEKLLAGLADLEKSISNGGDPLQDAAHDGGLATEGKNIQSRDEAKKSIVASLVKAGHSQAEAEKLCKMLSASDMGSSDDEDGDAGEEGAPDESDDDEEGAPPPMAKGKVKKSTAGAARLDAAAGGPSEMRKALVDENPDLEEPLDATPFLAAFVDKIGKSLGVNQQALGGLIKALTASNGAQSMRHMQIAKAFGALEQTIVALNAKVDKLMNQPVQRQLGTNVKKSDISNPEMHDGATELDGHGAPSSALFDVPLIKIQGRLYDMAIKGEVETLEVTKFENNKCDLSTLPPNIFKSLETHFCPAA